jgi:hypothetical protein
MRVGFVGERACWEDEVHVLIRDKMDEVVGVAAITPVRVFWSGPKWVVLVEVAGPNHRLSRRMCLKPGTQVLVCQVGVRWIIYIKNIDLAFRK